MKRSIYVVSLIVATSTFTMNAYAHNLETPKMQETTISDINLTKSNDYPDNTEVSYA